jgi:hypothetical protein
MPQEIPRNSEGVAIRGLTRIRTTYGITRKNSFSSPFLIRVYPRKSAASHFFGHKQLFQIRSTSHLKTRFAILRVSQNGRAGHGSFSRSIPTVQLLAKTNRCFLRNWNCFVGLGQLPGLGLISLSILHVLPNVRAGAVQVGEAIHSSQFT